MTTRLEAHLRAWLGEWPPPPGGVVVVGSGRRTQPGWDGQVHSLVGIADAQGGAVLSVPPGDEPAVRALGASLDAIGFGLADALGMEGARWGKGRFRWSEAPSTAFPEIGSWVPASDRRVPPWLGPFNGDVLVAWDEEGRYGAGVGRKQHDKWGHELAVATEERLRGRGLARALVAQAACRVLDDGAVPTYMHAPDNLASAQVAEASGFPDRGWQVLGLWPGHQAR